MAALSEDFEGVADGTNLTTSNTTFDYVNSGTTYEHDTGIALRGSVSALLGSNGTTTPYLVWNTTSWSGATTVYMRAYLQVSDATPSANTIIMSFREADGTTTGCDVRLKTDGKLQLRAPWTARDESTYTLSNNTTVRVEIKVTSNASTGTMDMRLFYGANLEGSTADETVSISNYDTGDGTVGGLALGIMTAPGAALNMSLDDVELNDTGWPGGAVAAETLSNNFETGESDGTAMTTANSDNGTAGDAWDAVTGTGTQVYDSDITLHDDLTGLLSVTSGQTSYLVWNGTSWAGNSDAYIRFYFRVSDATPTTTFRLLRISEADGSTIGCAVRLTDAGKIRITDGSAATLDTSTLTVSADTWYRLEVYVDSHASTGTFTCRIFTGSALEGNNPTETLTATSADTGDGTIGGIGVGIQSDPGQTLSMSLDSIAITDDTWLGPAGTPTVVYPNWLGVRANTDTTDAVDPPGDTPSSILVPASGSLLGGVFAPTGSGGQTTSTGLSQWVSAVGQRPHTIGFYVVGAWTEGEQQGTTAEQIAMFDPGGGEPHAIPHYRWKVGAGSSGGTWADVANGLYDTEIVAAATAIKAYPHKMFLSLFHEPEDNVSGGEMTTAWFKAHWQHVHDTFASEGASNVVWVLNFMGYKNHTSKWSEMDPGASYIDWVGFDPYTWTSDRNTWTELIDDADWYGPCWDWFAANHPTKPIMLCEFGSGSEWQSGYPAQTAAESAATIDDWIDIAPAIDSATYDNIKCHEYWNCRGKRDYQVQSSSLRAAALTRIVNLDHFDQDPDLFK